MKKITFLYTVIILLLTSCNSKKVYDKYSHTPISGWEKNDTLFFEVTKLADKGTYRPKLGLRINGAYPFMGLSLIVEQIIIPGDRTYIDTLNCNLIDKNGTAQGQGISYYQYNFPLHPIELQQGDSIVVRVRHDMKREILPGISDIGIQYTKH